MQHPLQATHSEGSSIIRFPLGCLEDGTAKFRQASKTFFKIPDGMASRTVNVSLYSSNLPCLQSETPAELTEGPGCPRPGTCITTRLEPLELSNQKLEQTGALGRLQSKPLFSVMRSSGSGEVTRPRSQYSEQSVVSLLPIQLFLSRWQGGLFVFMGVRKR